MSAKRRRGLSPDRDFQRVARSGADATPSVVQLRLGDHKLPPVTVTATEEAVTLAVQRLIMALATGGALRFAGEPEEPRAGRPRKPSLDAAAACYEFDVAHFDWLRKDWSNVPPDRVALDAAIGLLFPSDDPADDGLRLRRREQLKAAIKRRRAKRSSPGR